MAGSGDTRGLTTHLEAQRVVEAMLREEEKFKQNKLLGELLWPGHSERNGVQFPHEGREVADALEPYCLQRRGSSLSKHKWGARTSRLLG